MIVKDIIDIFEYPDDVNVQIYSYDVHDIVFVGLGERISEQLLDREIQSLEFPGTDKLIINIY